MRKSLPLIVFLGIAAAVLSGQQKLAGGPYAVNVSQKSATVGWVVEEEFNSLWYEAVDEKDSEGGSVKHA